MCSDGEGDARWRMSGSSYLQEKLVVLVHVHSMKQENYRMEGTFGGGKLWRMTMNLPKFDPPTFILD